MADPQTDYDALTAALEAQKANLTATGQFGQQEQQQYLDYTNQLLAAKFQRDRAKAAQRAAAQGGPTLFDPNSPQFTDQNFGTKSGSGVTVQSPGIDPTTSGWVSPLTSLAQLPSAALSAGKAALVSIPNMAANINSSPWGRLAAAQASGGISELPELMSPGLHQRQSDFMRQQAARLPQPSPQYPIANAIGSMLPAVAATAFGGEEATVPAAIGFGLEGSGQAYYDARKAGQSPFAAAAASILPGAANAAMGLVGAKVPGGPIASTFLQGAKAAGLGVGAQAVSDEQAGLTYDPSRKIPFGDLGAMTERFLPTAVAGFGGGAIGHALSTSGPPKEGSVRQAAVDAAAAKEVEALKQQQPPASQPSPEAPVQPPEPPQEPAPSGLSTPAPEAPAAPVDKDALLKEKVSGLLSQANTPEEVDAAVESLPKSVQNHAAVKPLVEARKAEISQAEIDDFLGIQKPPAAPPQSDSASSSTPPEPTAPEAAPPEPPQEATTTEAPAAPAGVENASTIRSNTRQLGEEGDAAQGREVPRGQDLQFEPEIGRGPGDGTGAGGEGAPVEEAQPVRQEGPARPRGSLGAVGQPEGGSGGVPAEGPQLDAASGQAQGQAQAGGLEEGVGQSGSQFDLNLPAGIDRNTLERELLDAHDDLTNARDAGKSKPHVDALRAEVRMAQRRLDAFDKSKAGSERHVDAPEPPQKTIFGDAANEARARLAAKAGKRGKESGVGNVYGDIADWAIIGASHIENGIRDFEAFSKKMLDEFGERIRPHLKAVFKASREAYAKKIREAVIPEARTPPPLEESTANVNRMADNIKKVFAPASRGAGAADMAGNVRAHVGEMKLVGAREQASVKNLRESFEPVPAGKRLMFIDGMEAGREQPTTRDTQAAGVLRYILDAKAEAVRALGTGKLENLIKDYMPHIWRDPAKAQNWLGQVLGRKPLEGPKSFLKKRTIPTTLEGMFPEGPPADLENMDHQQVEAEVKRQGGLMPVTTNPVELALLKNHEMDRYIMGQKIVQEAKAKGQLQFFRNGEDKPDGYSLINDRVSKVFAPPMEGGAGPQLVGHYYAPDEVATVLNNYISPGLSSTPLGFMYDGWKWAGNNLNMASLAISAYHATGTAINAALSQAAMAGRHLAAGEPIEAGKALVKAPLAPLLHAMAGAKVRAEYETAGMVPEMADVVRNIVRGNAATTVDPFYQNNEVSKFWQALQEGKKGQAAARSVPALMEYSSRWLMKHYVPMVKLGAFADMARFAEEHLPADATEEMRRDAAMKASDSVDNRFGQIVYGNVFWHKYLKDTASVFMRSPGWNLGTVREVGGGAVDLMKMPLASIKAGKVVLTDRGAYTLSLLAGSALLGGMTTYLMTGEPPKELKDWYYPRTGRKNPDGSDERIQFPTYMKDVINYGRHPLKTVAGKEHPLIGSIVDMLQNKDFFGDEIRNPEDPVATQLKQELEYIGKQFEPISIKNMQQQSRSGQSAATIAAGAAGIAPAPRWVVRSAAQNKMQELLSRGETGKTPEQQAQISMEMDLLRGVHADASAGGRALREAEQQGKISKKQAWEILRKAHENPLESKFKQLQALDALKVYKLGTDEEKKLWRPTLNGKFGRWLADGVRDPKQVQEFRDALGIKQKAMAAP